MIRSDWIIGLRIASGSSSAFGAWRIWPHSASFCSRSVLRSLRAEPSSFRRWSISCRRSSTLTMPSFCSTARMRAASSSTFLRCSAIWVPSHSPASAEVPERRSSACWMYAFDSAFAAWAASSGRKASKLTLTRRLLRIGCTRTRPRKASTTPSISGERPGADAVSAATWSGARGPPSSGSFSRPAVSTTCRASVRLCSSLYCVW